MHASEYRTCTAPDYLNHTKSSENLSSTYCWGKGSVYIICKIRISINHMRAWHTVRHTTTHSCLTDALTSWMTNPEALAGLARLRKTETVRGRKRVIRRTVDIV